MATEIKDYSSKSFLAKQGMNFIPLVEQLAKLLSAFEQNLDQLDDEQFYKPLQKDKWTPAEIADHIIRSQQIFARAIRDSLAGQAILIMPKGSVSKEDKPLSPEQLLPIARRGRIDLCKELWSSYAALKEAGSQASHENRLAETCMIHAFLGPLSILESLQLSAWHVRHHNRQLPQSQP